MMTVREVAKRYGITVGAMKQALAKIRYNAANPDSPLSAAVIHRFEMEWGDKIRKLRPAPEPKFSGETDIAPSTSRSTRLPKPQVMRVAHSKITSGRDASGLAEKRLLPHPERVHAIHAAGTRDGDPWAGEVMSGAVHFYDGVAGSGPPAACGWVRVRAVLGDEFVPADDPQSEGQCSLCAEIVSGGGGFRNQPEPYAFYRSPFCEDYLRIRVDGAVRVKDCRLRSFHDGPHRADDGAEWSIGLDDYMPASHELGRSITRAS